MNIVLKNREKVASVGVAMWPCVHCERLLSFEDLDFALATRDAELRVILSEEAFCALRRVDGRIFLGLELGTIAVRSPFEWILMGWKGVLMGWGSGVFWGFLWAFSCVDTADEDESELFSAVDEEGHEDDDDDDLGMSEFSSELLCGGLRAVIRGWEGGAGVKG